MPSSRSARSSRLTARAVRLVLLGLLLAALAGCPSLRPWVNPPLTARMESPALPIDPAQERDPSLLVVVALSGGGARAAAFGYGVLDALRDTRFVWNGRPTSLLDETDLVSGVSGGSIVAAYLAAFGSEGLAGFERDYLRHNFQNSLIGHALRPASLHALSSPWLGRSHLLAQRLDDLYRGRTFGELPNRLGHPNLLITATDLSLGTAFEFTPDQFDLLCSRLADVPLSFAVAASSAVPLVLSPMTLHNHRAHCLWSDATRTERQPELEDYRARLVQEQERSYLDAAARPYIHLVDGGLSDNLGLRRLLDRALAGESLGWQLVRGAAPARTAVRRLVLIAVNSERDPSVNIDTSDRLPGIPQVVDSLLFGTGARATKETQAFLTDVARRWQAELAARAAIGGDVFARDAELHVIQVNLRDAADEPTRRRLLQIPTAFSVGPAEVTELIEAGRRVLQASPQFQALLKGLAPQAP
ncbi:MAG: patatin-like phospholipase family protein [Rhodoferax sp.]|nr:patatin-like phospholipase family protein [Rhodoferax sp.]